MAAGDRRDEAANREAHIVGPAGEPELYQPPERPHQRGVRALPGAEAEGGGGFGDVEGQGGAGARDVEPVGEMAQQQEGRRKWAMRSQNGHAFGERQAWLRGLLFASWRENTESATEKRSPGNRSCTGRDPRRRNPLCPLEPQTALDERATRARTAPVPSPPSTVGGNVPGSDLPTRHGPRRATSSGTSEPPPRGVTSRSLRALRRRPRCSPGARRDPRATLGGCSRLAVKRLRGCLVRVGGRGWRS